MTIEIPGRMPGINDIVKDAKRGRGKYQPYAIAKKEWTETVAWCAKKLPAYNKIDIEITWYEPNRRRDPDNIAGGGCKVIMDGLVMAGTIKDDSQKYVRSIKHNFDVDKDNPRVEIAIEEAGR